MSRLAGNILAAISGLSLATAAAAQSTFHVKEFDYERGKWVFETINAYQGGFKPRSDRVQWGHELGLAYAVTDWWLPKVLVSFDKDEGGPYEVQRLLLENTFKLRPIEDGKDGFGLAWFQSLEGALNRHQTNSTAFGPIFTAQSGKFSISTNTFFDKSFGQNREPGINFLYAWQARYEIMDKVKVGVEGYGFIPEIGARSPTPETGQTNRIGPVLIIEFDMPGNGRAAGTGAARAPHTVRHAARGANGKDEPPHAEIEFGVLFGTTDYTPDVTGKINMHVHF